MTRSADMHLLESNALECDEAVLTGEAMSVTKQTDATRPDDVNARGNRCRDRCGLRCRGAHGNETAFGHIAIGLGERHADTAFQVGLRDFSFLLVRVAAVLTVSIFVINVLLSRPVIEALLFSLAIAIGLTPQSCSHDRHRELVTGSRRLAERKVLVKRLVSIEDLGNITLLFTDKTGTLTEGHIAFGRSIDGAGSTSDRGVLLGSLPPKRRSVSTMW